MLDQSGSTSSSSEYLHYDRLQDHEDLELFVKQKLKRHIKHNTGVEIPDHCIKPSILKWSQMSRDYYQDIETAGPEVKEQLQKWLDLHEPYRMIRDELEEETNKEMLFEVITGVADIEAW